MSVAAQLKERESVYPSNVSPITARLVQEIDEEFYCELLSTMHILESMDLGLVEIHRGHHAQHGPLIIGKTADGRALVTFILRAASSRF